MNDLQGFSLKKVLTLRIRTFSMQYSCNLFTIKMLNVCLTFKFQMKNFQCVIWDYISTKQREFESAHRGLRTSATNARIMVESTNYFGKLWRKYGVKSTHTRHHWNAVDRIRRSIRAVGNRKAIRRLQTKIPELSIFSTIHHRFLSRRQN